MIEISDVDLERAAESLYYERCRQYIDDNSALMPPLPWVKYDKKERIREQAYACIKSYLFGE